jgi:hypothetical protein
MNNLKPRVYKIPSTQNNIFKRYLCIVNGMLSSKSRLTELEIEVLDKMLVVDYMYRNYTKEKRDKIIFNNITKDKIREEVYGISKFSYNNILTKLRKKGFIIGNTLNTVVPIIDNKIELTFKLEIV